jgi:hypothetical protein
MSHGRYFRREYRIYWIVILSACGISSTCSGQGACYSTPRAAIDSSRPLSLISPMSKRGGYRVTSIQSDVVLGQKWALIASCDHPEWPTLALQMYGSNPLPSTLPIRRTLQDGIISAIPVVRAGDPVRLWKQEDLLRIEIAGISEESGNLGNKIRVRLLHRNTDDQAMQEEFSGIIRGPSDVEMQP